MAKGQEYSKYQKKIISRFYEHADTLRNDRLSDLVAEIYLAETDKKKASLWAKARKTLEALKADPVTIERVVDKQDVEGLAKLAQTLDRK